MSNVTIKFSRPVNTEELREVLAFAENQETTDKYTLANENMKIKGNYANIEVKVDEDGNFEVL